MYDQGCSLSEAAGIREKMATGLLGLLDDVVALAKLAAASVDDVAAQAVKTTGSATGHR